MFARFTTVLLLSAGCDPGHIPPAPTRPEALLLTLNDLSAFGPKRAGTESGRMAGDYVKARMEKIGLSDVHGESFQFPRQDVSAASLSVNISGVSSSPAIDVFDGSGTGHIEAPVVWVGASVPFGMDLTGRIALVERTDWEDFVAEQYWQVVSANALAMIHLSIAPDNLRQLASVRGSSGTLGPIPAVTLAASDGASLKSALSGQTTKPVSATIDVKADSSPASGTNIVGRIVGKRPEQIVIGAHYDSWFAGSTDNGGGVAALLALAERRTRQDEPRFTLVFVAYDAQELALYGSYDYLRKHQVLAPDPILVVLNFETPSASGAPVRMLARSNYLDLEDALDSSGIDPLYPQLTTIYDVPSRFGGTIPFDIRGVYLTGAVATIASTWVSSPYHHTTADTPDKVDTAMLAPVVDAFDLALESLLADDPSRFEGGIPGELLVTETQVNQRKAGEAVTLGVTIKGDTNLKTGFAPQWMAAVKATLLFDDFFPAATAAAMTDASGKATFQFSANAAAMGTGNRFVHITSGFKNQLGERIISIQ